MAAVARIDTIRTRLDRAVEMRSLRDSMRELSEASRPSADEPPPPSERGGSSSSPVAGTSAPPD